MNKGKITPAQESESPEEPTALNLKALRETKGIALRDIFIATRVTMVNLEAIEQGDFHLLPEPVYARTFIKTYAKFLDIDSRPILDRYEQYLNTVNNPPLPKEDPGNKAEDELKARRNRRPFIRLGVLAVIVLALVYVIFPIDSNIYNLLNPQTPQPEKPVVAEQPKAAAPQPADSQTAPNPNAMPAVPTKEAAPQADTSPLPPKKAENRAALVQQPPSATSRQVQGTHAEKRYRLVIMGTEKTWLRIREDQKQTQEMILNKGDVVERFASDSFALDIGNAGGVEILFQGKSLGSLGERGQVVHFKLP